MLKPVDTQEEITGFSYKNQDGEVEHVTTAHYDGTVTIVADHVQQPAKVYIYKADIPMLIKALQAAYDHKE